MRSLALAMLLILVAVGCTEEIAEEAMSNGRRDTTAGPGTLHLELRSGDEVDTATFEVTDSVIRQKKQVFPDPGGSIVNLLITGTEPSTSIKPSGSFAHHLVRFYTDSGSIEIISVSPFAMEGAEKDVQTRIKSVTGVKKIHHVVSMDFDQAVMILDLMGYNDAKGTFKRLKESPRTRAGRIQRAYDQGRFIRTVLLRGIRRTNDVVGDLAVRAALSIVDTDMTYDETSKILQDVQKSGFGDDPKRIWVRIAPSEDILTSDT